MFLRCWPWVGGFTLPHGRQSTGLQRVGHNQATNTFTQMKDLIEQFIRLKILNWNLLSLHIILEHLRNLMSVIEVLDLHYLSMFVNQTTEVL